MTPKTNLLIAKVKLRQSSVVLVGVCGFGAVQNITEVQAGTQEWREEN